MSPFSWSSRDWAKSLGVVLIGGLFGFASWWILARLTGEKEPWGMSFMLYVYVLLIGGAAATILFPRGFWMAPLAIFAGQLVYGLYWYESTNAFMLTLTLAKAGVFCFAALIGALACAILMGVSSLLLAALHKVLGWTTLKPAVKSDD